MTYRFAVHRDDVLNTFTKRDEVKLAHAYDEITARDSIGNKAELARELGLTRGQMTSILKGRPPYGLKATGALEDMGLLPIALEGKNFPLFHTLSCMTAWRGHIAHAAPPSTPVGQTLIRPVDSVQRDFVSSFLEQSGIPQFEAGDSFGLSNRISRLLLAAGHPLGRRKGHASAIPKYIIKAIDAYDGDDTIIEHLLCEFVVSMLFFRLKHAEQIGWIVNLRALDDATSAETQAEHIIRAVQIAFPDMNVRVHGPSFRDEIYRTRLVFDGDAQCARYHQRTYPQETMTWVFGDDESS